MRIAIDLTPLRRRPTGVDRYLLELVPALAAVDADTAYVLFLNRGDRERLPALPANFRTVVLPFRGRGARLAFQQAVLPAWLRRLDVRVLHSPSFFVPLAAPGTRHVLTVHDLTFFSLPGMHNRLRRSRPFRAGVRASIRRADVVIVPSATTAADVRRLVPGRAAETIRAIPLGVAARFAPLTAEATTPVLARLGIRRPYLLHVGTLEPRKNVESLLDAYRGLAADGRVELDLVLVGRAGWGCAALLRQIQSPELSGRVHHLGYVADDDLPALYAGARLFVFPSSYEGFGLPPLEAMSCGTPVLASAAGALAETLTGAAALVSPSAAGIRDGIERVLGDPVGLARLRAEGLARAAGFRWERTARATRACYDELARAT